MPSTSPARYLSTDELRALVLAYRRNRGKSDELGRALLAIAGGVWDRYRFTADREEFCQEVALHLLQRPLEKADVQKHLFNYFTTCTIRYGMKLREKANGDRRRFNTYAAECLEAGRPIPRRGEDVDGAYVEEYLSGGEPQKKPTVCRRGRRALNLRLPPHSTPRG
jgi:hypothetical protein